MFFVQHAVGVEGQERQGIFLALCVCENTVYVTILSEVNNDQFEGGYIG